MPRVWTEEQREKTRQTRAANKARKNAEQPANPVEDIYAKLEQAEKAMTEQQKVDPAQGQEPTPIEPVQTMPTQTIEDIEAILFKMDAAIRQSNAPPKVELKREGDHMVQAVIEIAEVPEYKIDDQPKRRPGFVEENKKGWVEVE